MRKTIIAVFVVLLLACTNRGKIRETYFVSLWDTSRAITNPGKGWYHHLLDNGVDKYKIKDDSLFRSFPGMDHIYLRLAWSYLEPEEGKFNWQVIDTIIERYVPLGYGISFRISSKETGKFPGTVNQEVDGIQYATPFWVKKAGAKGTVAVMWNTKSWVPDWDDPVYLKKLDAFHKAFAERYDGKPWLRYVDIGSIGEWGEGHTSFSTKIPPSVEEVKLNMDIFLKNYKKSQLICTDDLIYYGKNENDIKTLLDYAISCGISLRDDSPLVSWYIQNNLDTWSVSHPHFYDPLYLSKPIVFELQHYGMVKDDSNWLGLNGSDTIPRFKHSGAEIMRRAIETMHATYIGYHGYAEEWLADNPLLTKELANKCGYWYFPVSAKVKKVMKTGDNIISMKWINRGVAPAYENYNIVFRLENTFNNEVIESEIETAGNKAWLPDSIVEENYKLFLADNTPSGKYILKFKLINKSLTNPKMIDIGLRKDCFDKEGFVEIGTIRFH